MYESNSKWGIKWFIAVWPMTVEGFKWTCGGGTDRRAAPAAQRRHRARLPRAPAWPWECQDPEGARPAVGRLVRHPRHPPAPDVGSKPPGRWCPGSSSEPWCWCLECFILHIIHTKLWKWKTWRNILRSQKSEMDPQASFLWETLGENQFPYLC